MAAAMAEGRRILTPDGIGVVVFAHKSTSGWEALLQAMINAGWTFTGSWPIDTEMGSRLRAMDSAALASSIHLVCRPRENPAARSAQTTWATGAMSCPSFPGASTPGCPAWLRRAWWALMPSSPAWDRPWRSTAATLAWRRPAARWWPSRNTWKRSGRQSPARRWA